MALEVALATSSIPQIESVDSQKVIPARSAARAASTSARGANMPANPTGASTSGIDNVSPSTVVASARDETSRRTLWRNFNP